RLPAESQSADRSRRLHSRCPKRPAGAGDQGDERAQRKHPAPQSGRSTDCADPWSTRGHRRISSRDRCGDELGSVLRLNVARVLDVVVTTPPRRTVLDMDRYQWTVLFAAWLGWGFDIFDSLLFNYVAPTCVPVLLGIPLGTPAAGAATLRWTGILTSLL